MWSVRVLSGPQAGQIFDLKSGKNIFGRGNQCNVKILSIGISKEHCEIHVYKDKVMIVDLKSSNGTFVNGVKIQNSIIKLGDKLSLFDVIMDVIPTPEIRPRPSIPLSNAMIPKVKSSMNQIAMNGNLAQHMTPAVQTHSDFPQVQMQGHPQLVSADPLVSREALKVTEPQESLSYKVENYVENVVMASIYKTASIIPFKQVLLGFVLIFVLMVTALSLIPLNTITRESNYIEASKRARSLARSLARANETALASGNFTALSISEVMKEDGVEEALIVQQSDGAIVAPFEKAGKEVSRALVSEIRRELRSYVGKVSSKTIAASHPIGAYDVATGETQVKYHAIVYYDISSLNVDDGRVMSLFMQTLVYASLLGGVLYFVFSRLIQYPIVSLNKQIDAALRDKNDRTEVLFDYPAFQQLVANVNIILNRAMNHADQAGAMPAQPNRDLELNHMVEMISQSALVINSSHHIIAVNHSFEILSQMSKESLLQNPYTVITDNALMQNIEGLIAKAANAPYEKHTDRIPFSQFECEISLQAILGTQSEVEYYFIVLNQVQPE